MKPHIENAPGIDIRRRKDGTWFIRWEAQRALARRGFEPATQFLWRGTAEQITDATRLYLSRECQRLQGQMHLWAAGGVKGPIADGSLSGLINEYQSDPDSPYQQLRFITRRNYNYRLQRISKIVGDRSLAEIGFRDFKSWHTKWRYPEGADGPEHTDMAHEMMASIRIVINFGVAIEHPHCDRLALVLSKMQFPKGRARSEAIDAGQVVAIRKAAHEAGYPSVALAQALQFELTLRQKDVIGEWVPMSEPGLSAYADAGRKWLYGLRWDEIDKDLIVRHRISKSRKGKVAEFDLKLYPMAMEEIARVAAEDRQGAVIKNENTGLPYRGDIFRKRWRPIADKAGVPRGVFNMDSRAGGITEATDVMGDDIESVRHHAQHSDSKMTMRYSRGGLRKSAKVAQFRAKSREEGK